MTTFDAPPAFGRGAAARTTADPSSFERLFPFFRIVVVIQGVHVVEHIVQFLQVNVFNVPGERAFGLLGYVFQFNGTAEWMHLVFNVAYLASLVVIGWRLYGLFQNAALPSSILWLFAIGGVLLETWHMVEHVVIIANVVRHHGCPCPGIGDRVLGVTDIQLHLTYNAVTYSAVLLTFRFVAGMRSKARAILEA